MTLLQQLAVVVIGISILTAAATAVRSVSRIWLRHWVEQKLSGAMTPEVLLDRPQRLLLSAGAGVSALALLGGALIAVSETESTRTAVALSLFILAVVVVGQIVPRAFARRWPSVVLPLVLPLLRGVDLIVLPARALGRAIARRVQRAPASDQPADVIEDVLREGRLEGIGEHGEIAIITGVVHFGDKAVGDVMTPRAEVFALDADLAPRELARAIAGSGYSRVPVYQGAPDRLVGMIHAFDVMKTHGGALPVRAVETASARAPLNELLFRMLRSGHHLAVVQDDAQRALGIVTLEDLLEELVGDIRDEHDEPAVPRSPAAA